MVNIQCSWGPNGHELWLRATSWIIPERNYSVQPVITTTTMMHTKNICDGVHSGYTIECWQLSGMHAWNLTVSLKKRRTCAAASHAAYKVEQCLSLDCYSTPNSLGWSHPPFLRFLNSRTMATWYPLLSFNLIFWHCLEKKRDLFILASPSYYKRHEISGSWVKNTSITCLKINTYVLEKAAYLHQQKHKDEQMTR